MRSGKGKYVHHGNIISYDVGKQVTRLLLELNFSVIEILICIKIKILHCEESHYKKSKRVLCAALYEND